MSINNFAAIVSDNDGSAFVTKAEFDALKRDFNKQIDDYNTSIDGKIDGAIASYLAGIALINVFEEKSNIDVLSYPLTIVSKYNCLEGIDDLSGHQKAPILGFDYYIYTAYRNRVKEHVGLIDVKGNNQINAFLNGGWNTSDTEFLVDNVTLNPKFGTSGFSMADHFVATMTEDPTGWNAYDDKYTFVCYPFSKFTDCSVEMPRWNKNTKMEVAGKVTLAQNFNWLKCLTNDSTNPDKIKMVPYGISCTTDKWFDGYGSSDDLDYTPNGSVITATDQALPARLSNYDTSLISDTYTYGDLNNKINLVYQFDERKETGSEKQKYLACVSYGTDHRIWVTNKKKNREIKKISSPKQQMWGHRTAPGTVSAGNGVLGLITTGYDLESIYTTRTSPDKTKMSLTLPSELYYNFTGVSVSTKHHMVDGIPIWEVPSTYNGNMTSLIINLNIQSESSTTLSNEKYVIFSKKPITDCYSSSISWPAINSNTDYMVIKRGNKYSTYDRVGICTEGNNLFEIQPMNKGEILYMKILFDDDSEQYVTLKEAPSFIVGKE